MNQHTSILKRLKRGWATPLDILRECGSMKASTRIGELRMAGHVIVDKWVEQNGKRFKSYRLVK
jgi:hypothetical protein